LAERHEIARLDRLDPLFHHRAHPVEETLVARPLVFPARAQTSHGAPGAARIAAEADDQRDVTRRAQRGDGRRLAAREAKEAAVAHRRRRIDARRLAVEDALEPAAEREHLVAPERAAGDTR